MRYVALIAGLVLGISEAAGVEPPQPTNADFIPSSARVYFGTASGAQYWGDEVTNFHFALRASELKHSYVEGGGYGEPISLGVTLFTSDADEKWSEKNSLRFRLTVRAPGLRDYSRIVTTDSTGFSGNSDGSCWDSPFEISIRELRQHWGRIPPKISLVATLDETDLPAASTAIVSLELAPIAREKASRSQLLASLSAGQTRNEIESLLGAPSSTKTIVTEDGKQMQVMVYPDPDAPANFPPAQRNTEIFLDADGRFVSYFRTMFRC